jgi:hypothetical protein
MTAPVRIETPAVQYSEATESMPSDFDRLIQSSVNQLMFNDSKMDRMLKTAEIMASGKTTIPAHLRGSVGDCMAIVLQAAQWNMNPFSVAQKTHLVNGTLGYEAQLVNAVVITRAPIIGRPQFAWEGDWSQVNGKACKDDKLAVTISATFQGDTEPTSHRVSMAQAVVRNSPLWEHDPRMQLAYLAIKRWARLYCPDVLLGVYSADELEAPEVTAAPPVTGSRTEQAKAKLRTTNAREPIVADLPPHDPETGEILPAEPEADPIADLILAISECQTREELEQHRAAVASLKNGMKKRAVDAWKAVEATFPKAA